MVDNIHFDDFEINPKGDPASKRIWEEFLKVEEDYDGFQPFCCRLAVEAAKTGGGVFKIERDGRMLAMLLPLNFCPCCGKKLPNNG